jgi:3-phenylpropionate/trans-cinnamate dioxygenase ferredoxin reductase subunit
VRMGQAAARNMLGAGSVFDDPHWFWSDQYDSQIQMAGHAPTWDSMVIRGSLEARSFCAFLLDATGTVRGSVSVDRPRDVRRSIGLIASGASPPAELLADPDVDIRTLVRKEADA